MFMLGEQREYSMNSARNFFTELHSEMNDVHLDKNREF